MDIENKDGSSSEMRDGSSNSQNSEVEVNPDLEKLHFYNHTKLVLAGQLRILREVLTTLGRENGERQCGEIIVKLAEDRFTLAVVGQFKRGKSSLMNAIIGRELLPTGVIPLTSAITVLKYGPKERLVVRCTGALFPKELPISCLSDYVTEKGNPSNRKKVKTACVELPVPFLRCGIEFVDTPGVGSAITANTMTTYSFLPECDAVLFVTSVDTPMTSSELVFLKEIRQYVDRIFFVVNKIDLLAEDERNEVMRFVKDTIKAEIGSDAVKVFPVSAQLGLAARISGSQACYEQSGIRALEESLAVFLSEEKAAVFLSAVAHKALQVMDGEKKQGAFKKTTIQSRFLTMQTEKSVMIKRNPYVAAELAKSVRTKLEALYDGICDGRMADVAANMDLVVKTTQKEQEMSDHVVVGTMPVGADIVGDLKTRGCPVCDHMEEYARDFFAQWQYKISINEETQAEFASELGFCPFHTWQLLALSSPQGASVGFARLAELVAKHLRECVAVPEQVDMVRQLVHDSSNCHVCELLRKVEAEYIKQLAVLIGDIAGRRQYQRSQGVCLKHLGMLLEITSAKEIRDFLLAHAAKRFEEDAEDMQSYALKHEAIRRTLQNSNEEDAYMRAIIRMVGERNAWMPWLEE